jgi:hypothetical protein
LSRKRAKTKFRGGPKDLAKSTVFNAADQLKFRLQHQPDPVQHEGMIISEQNARSHQGFSSSQRDTHDNFDATAGARVQEKVSSNKPNSLLDADESQATAALNCACIEAAPVIADG